MEQTKEPALLKKGVGEAHPFFTMNFVFCPAFSAVS